MTLENIDISLVLFCLVAFTGLFWIADKLYFKPQRKRQAEAAIANFQKEGADALRASKGEAEVAATIKNLRNQHMQHPGWLDWTANFFPVLFFVFVLRSFVVEPFNIPSGSMMPTLLEGDFILVNKYNYGIKLPVLNKKVIEIGKPQRGDVVVFRPPHENMNFIKRLVGLPGDKIKYENKDGIKTLSINGAIQSQTKVGDYAVLCTQDSKLKQGLDGATQTEISENCKRKIDPKNPTSKTLVELTETTGNVKHNILNSPELPAVRHQQVNFHQSKQAQFSYLCNYADDDNSFDCTIPPGHYFMMGDNRDGSSDSRYWGFVPEENIVGKAFFIWMHCDCSISKWEFHPDLSRIGRFN